MIEQVAQKVKQNVKTSISVASIVSLTTLGGIFIQLGDYRWALAEDAQENRQFMRSHIEQQLEDDIMVINMKQNGATQAQIDAALKAKYEARLEAMRSEKK